MDRAFRGVRITMAAKPEDLANSIAGDANYPDGSGQDETIPGSSDDGTGLLAVIYNDIQGFKQGLLSNENITADGLADTVLASQSRDGLKRLVARGGDLDDVAATATCILGDINTPLNAGGAITVKLPPTAGLYAGAVVIFDAFPPVAYSINPVTFDGDGETIGDTAGTVELKTDGFYGGFRRNRANTKWVPFKSTAIGTEL